MINYRRELKMRANIRRKGKIEKIIKFAKRMKRIQEKVVVVLKRAQKKIKKQVDKRGGKIKVQNKENKVMLNTKDLVFKK